MSTVILCGPPLLGHSSTPPPFTPPSPPTPIRSLTLPVPMPGLQSAGTRDPGALGAKSFPQHPPQLSPPGSPKTPNSIMGGRKEVHRCLGLGFWGWGEAIQAPPTQAHTHIQIHTHTHTHTPSSPARPLRRPSAGQPPIFLKLLLPRCTPWGGSRPAFRLCPALSSLCLLRAIPQPETWLPYSRSWSPLEAHPDPLSHDLACPSPSPEDPRSPPTLCPDLPSRPVPSLQ